MVCTQQACLTLAMGNQLRKEVRFLLVYVINKHGKPLMPCKPSKARKLLKQGKARVVQRTPFTIQLLHGSSGYKQPVSLGVDAGSKVVGLSATTEKKVLFEAEVELRNDITKLLADRRELRRSRRYRKTRYRKARFLNRRKPEGWLAPYNGPGPAGPKGEAWYFGDWQNSKGCLREMETAKKLGIHLREGLGQND